MNTALEQWSASAFKRIKAKFALIALLVVIACVHLADAQTTGDESAVSGFVKREGSRLVLGNDEFRFLGANNYYMHHKPYEMIDDVLASASGMNVSVLRVWGFLDGLGDHSFHMQPQLGVFEPLPGNESAWERLDYTVAKAGESGIRLLIVLTNNWSDFGGIPQYAKWLELENEDDFFTDERARAAYRRFAQTLIERVNTVTGVAYRDDPTIMAWSLCNEPRCESDPSGRTLLEWTREMSAFVKAIAPNQLVTLGSEGFFRRESDQWTHNGQAGVDWESIIALDTIDFGTFHLYPEHWGIPDSEFVQWGTRWITEHAEAARLAGKPIVLDEYGVGISTRQNRAYAFREWTDTIYEQGLAGSMFWTLTGLDNSPEADGEGLFPNFDGFRVLNDDSDVSNILRQHGTMMAGGKDNRTDTLYFASPGKPGPATGVMTVRTVPITEEHIESVVLHTPTMRLSMVDPDSDGRFKVEWDSRREAEDEEITLRAVASLSSGDILEASVAVKIQNEFVWAEVYQARDQSDLEAWHQSAAWQASWGSSKIEVSDKFDVPALRVDGAWSGDAEWQELRITSGDLPWLDSCERITFDLLIPVGAQERSPHAEASVRPYVALDPGWIKVPAEAPSVKLSELDTSIIEGEEYLVYPFVAQWTSVEGLRRFSISLVGSWMSYEGPIYIRDITGYERR